MKHVIATGLFCMLLFLYGCTSAEEVPVMLDPVINESVAPEENVAVDTTEALVAVSVPLSTETYSLDDGTELFTYSFQHMNLIFPDVQVADKVTLEFLNRVDASQSEANTIREIAKADQLQADHWNPYFYRVIYSPTRIDYGVMSLFGTQTSFTGGMHGNVSCISANYDMMTGDVLTLGSIMHADASKEAFIDIIIDKLSSVKDDYYLFDDFDVAVRQRLGGDENVYEDFFFTATGLNFFFSPYEIAPYSSGIITVEISYEELPGLIYDGYFPAERQLVEGNMQAGTFMETDMEQFNNMSEVILPGSEEMFVVYPAGSVENISVKIKGDGMTVPDYTVFASPAMSEKDAIILHIPTGYSNRINISYASAGETAVLSLSE